jgi:hypothetical protein
MEIADREIFLDAEKVRCYQIKNRGDLILFTADK